MLYSAIRTFSVNIGDEIQTLAALRFLPRVDSWIDRERMPDCSGRPDSFVIANGWFMHRPERFPPPENVHPFYVSMHIHDASLLTTHAVAHLRRWEPIGCRDNHTLALLRARGVASYFSGCLTWTLPRPDIERGDEVLAVDVPLRMRRGMPPELRRHAVTLTHTRYHGMSVEYHPATAWFVPWRVRQFCEDARDRGLLAAVTECRPARVASPHAVSTRRLELAASLLRRYAGARLVFTNRIHCLFPCLAFGTPVFLVHDDKVFAPQRLSIDEPFMKRYGLSDLRSRGWQPPPAMDVSRHRRFLELLCTRAVEIQDNPLRHEAIDEYYRAAGWQGSGISRG